MLNGEFVVPGICDILALSVVCNLVQFVGDRRQSEAVILESAEPRYYLLHKKSNVGEQY